MHNHYFFKLLKSVLALFCYLTAYSLLTISALLTSFHRSKQWLMTGARPDERVEVVAAVAAATRFCKSTFASFKNNPNYKV
jgi:hypothetical protein